MMTSTTEKQLIENHIRLLNAIGDGDIAAVTCLMPLFTPSTANRQAVEYATRLGHTDIVKLLLTVFNPKASSGRNYALTLAAERGYTEIAEILLPYCDPTEGNNSALCLAARNGHLDTLKLFLPYCTEQEGRNLALLEAAENGHTDVVKHLIPISNAHFRNNAALLFAARNNHFDAVKLLIPASNYKKIYDTLVNNHCNMTVVQRFIDEHETALQKQRLMEIVEHIPCTKQTLKRKI